MNLTTNNGVILLVEDNAALAELAKNFLLEGKFTEEVVWVRDGLEAIDYLHAEGRTPREMPSLVLLDLSMPRLDGFEVLKQMREEQRTRFVPVVVLTSSDRPEDVLRAYSLGANGYVDKISGRVPWPEVMQTVARYWCGMNIAPYSLAGYDDGFARGGSGGGVDFVERDY